MAAVQVEVIRRTQETLGNVIKKPPLNEKLLNKPPFRFLHDIVTNVIKTTGFMKGLYTDHEMVSDNVKDKDSKIAFLQKSIDVVVMVTGEALSARPAKIVAGQEPEKTNQFLQALAKGVLTKKDTSDAVKRVLAGEKPSNKKETKTANNQQKGKESTNKSRAKTDKKSKVKKVAETTEVIPEPAEVEPALNSRESSAKENQPEVVEKTLEAVFDAPIPANPETTMEPIVPASPEKLPEAPEPQLQPPEPEPERPATSTRPTASNRKSTARPTRESSARRTTTSVDNAEKTPPPAPKENSPKPTPKMTPTPTSSNRSSRPTTTRPTTGRPTTARPMTSRPITARPTTARPAPPRILNKNIVDVEETRAPSAKMVSALILDDKDDEEDEGFVVEDTVENNDLMAEINSAAPVTNSGSDITEDEQRGSLVKQMLETKKGLEGGSQQRRTEMDKSQMTSDPGKRKERETSGKELEQLRQFIQTVSRSANPLGKMLDYLQEDIDAMNQELKTWHEEHQQNLVALKREEAVTESVLDPLGRQLEELEQSVADQLDKISALKATVCHNDERIQRMLSRAHNPV